MFLDLLFPKICLGCHQWGSYLCPDCQKKIRSVLNQICPVCSLPSLKGKTHSFCQNKERLDGLITLFYYRGLIKEAISKLKYKLVRDLKESLIKLIIKQLLLQKPPFLKDSSLILVPIPLHYKRQNYRGFNQTEIIGQELAAFFNWQFKKDLLKRRKNIPPQVSLNRKQRQENVKGIFEISNKNESLIRKQSFLVFDDVWTTGSTLEEAALVLKKKGAKKVWGLTICR